jgi:hypothetical protein
MMSKIKTFIFSCAKKFIFFLLVNLGTVGGGIVPNEQGLLQSWNSLLVRPEPLLIKDMTRPEIS